MGFKAPDILNRDIFMRSRDRANFSVGEKNFLPVVFFLLIGFLTIFCIFVAFWCKITIRHYDYEWPRNPIPNFVKFYQQFRFFSVSKKICKKRKYFAFGPKNSPKTKKNYEILVEPPDRHPIDPIDPTDPTDPTDSIDSSETSCTILLSPNSACTTPV